MIILQFKKILLHSNSENIIKLQLRKYFIFHLIKYYDIAIQKTLLY